MEDQPIGSENESPIIEANVIRIQLRKPSHTKWELRTRNLSPGIKFPTIQLFDCEGNLLVETNDDNISIESNHLENTSIKGSKSLKERDFKHIVSRNIIKKHNTICGDRIYTRLFRVPLKNCQDINGNINNNYRIKNCDGVYNIPKQNLLSPHIFQNDSSLQASDACSDISSYKSSDNEHSDYYQYLNNIPQKNMPRQEYACLSSVHAKRNPVINIEKEKITDNKNCKSPPLQKSKSFSNYQNPFQKGLSAECLSRSKSGVVYRPPQNKVPFLNTYLKSLPRRTSSNLDWLGISHRDSQSSQPTQGPVSTVKLRDSPKLLTKPSRRFCNICDNTSENDSLNIPTDVAAEKEMKKRLKIYRRGMSEIETKQRKAKQCDRRLSMCDLSNENRCGSSSESVDEADVVLNRLRRRIMRNKMRTKRKYAGTQKSRKRKVEFSNQSSDEERHDGAACKARLRQSTMGSNISQHSSKGLKGRRARSSGDLCNGDTKSQTESSVCGSVVGEAMAWNRSLPNHLDGNRHLADYSRVNNNYGELGTYSRYNMKGGRGLRYRVSKSGSELEPVWKLQDAGCDQGYGSERSPEEDFAPPLPQPVSIEEYEAQLRAVYPFINDDNTFTVVVEKDGRGLGMSVCGGGGLVRIRRLYPPQPAWRTGKLAPRDLLLAANGVPLAGLSTYEALEVLRTASPRVELRVCRAPPDAVESITPPDPPTPPVRTPHPPHLPPLDPLNCHPMHTRLSQTTSSATTSSSEGRGRREASPEHDRRELRLPDLERNLPVFDVQYGDDGTVEFDIVMTKVNGSLGFTLRKEDHSALGHYVRALVREPALSDGRIQPGDRIVAVNETSMSNMSHTEAVAFLRSCDSDVRLRLYRDNAATPLSPTSPASPPPDRQRTPLRPEAVTMLCDLAARRLTPDAVDGARSPCLSPRKCRKLTRDDNHYNHVPPHGYELSSLDMDTLHAPAVYAELTAPASLPPAPLASFAHSNPTYQSAMLSSNIDSKDDANNLKKWKGVTLSPENERKSKPEPPQPPVEPLEQKENLVPEPEDGETNNEPTIVSVELNRGWNSRLGFSVQSHPESGQSYISAVYSDSVAARDGRLRQGDVILQVNDENVTSMKTPEVIDLLRLLRGSICITVLRPPTSQ